MSAADMPKLPEAGWMLWCHNAYENPYHSHQDGYTDDEMREYARAHAAAVAAPLVDALEALMAGCVFKSLHGEPPYWHEKAMPTNSALDKARAALAAFKEKA